MNFCSNCGHKINFGEVPDDDRSRYFCEKCGAIHYENPNMIVGCLPVLGDKVLLCKRAIEPRLGKWTLPAGFLEHGERLEAGAVRETVEEANATVEIERLFSVYSLPHVGQVYFLFLADLQTEGFHPGAETLETRLFTEDEIPWEEIAFSAVKFTLEKFFSKVDRDSVRVHLGGRDVSWR